MTTPSNIGRPAPTMESSSSNTGRPKTFTYKDPYAMGKTYPMRSTTSHVKVSDTPFEPEIMRHLIGKNGNPDKAKVQLTSSAVTFPMTDNKGRNVSVTGHFLQYRGAGGSALITPGGEVITKMPDAVMKKDMAPSMARPKAQFEPYSIPLSEMTQPASNFSHFTFEK